MCGRYTPAITTFCLRGRERRGKVQGYRCAQVRASPISGDSADVAQGETRRYARRFSSSSARGQTSDYDPRDG